MTLLLVGGQFPPLTQLRTGPAQIDTRTQETRPSTKAPTLSTRIDRIRRLRGRFAHPGALGRSCQSSEPPKGKAAVGDPQRLSDNEQLEILALLEAVSTERSAIRAARALAQLMGRLHGLGQRIAGELPDLDRGIERASR